MGDIVARQDFGGLGGFLGGLVQKGASPELQMIEDEQYTDRIISAIEDGFLSRINTPTIFSVEDALRPVNVADGINEFETNYVKGLLDQGLVTVADVAQQTGIPEQDIQDTYNQMSRRPLFDVLNDTTDATAGLINLTVGSNQMLDDAALAAAGTTAQETVDLTEDTTASTITSGNGSLGDAADLGTADQGTVSDTIESWKYDKSSDSFISTVNGDVVKRTGDPDVPLKDGGEYYIRGVEGTDGATAEHVVNKETNESVGIFNIDINTGLPSITKILNTGTTVSNGDLNNNNGNGDLNNGNGNGDLNNGNGNGDTTTTTTTNNDKWKNSGKGTVTETVGQRVIGDGVTATPSNGIDGKDGTDGTNGTNGQDGRDGRDGKDGKDGKDGMIGLFSSIQNTPITESILFTPKFTKLENVQQGMFDEFLRAAGGNR